MSCIALQGNATRNNERRNPPVNPPVNAQVNRQANPLDVNQQVMRTVPTEMWGNPDMEQTMASFFRMCRQEGHQNTIF